MSDVRLLVGGTRYGGWKSIRITRTMQAACGSFDLEVNDRWAGQSTPWPIGEEAPCKVVIDDQVVIDGYVGKRDIDFDEASHSLSYGGRDRAAALVDSEAVLEEWTFRKASLLRVAEAVAKSHGVKISLQPGLDLPPPPPKFVVSPGETGFEIIRRASQAVGALVVSDGSGGLVVTRAGAGRAQVALVEGRNVRSGRVSYDADDRFHRYVVVTQVAGTDNASGAAVSIRAEAVDQEVARTSRTKLIRPEAGITTDYARRRAAWEMRTRAARAEQVSLRVRGWQQRPGGALWPVNALVTVQSPTLGLDGDLLIVTAEHSIDDRSGEVTDLQLMRPDAFSPEPIIRKGTSSGLWKELAGGV